MIPRRSYGRSGLMLSSLGLGAAQLGAASLTGHEAASLLAAAVDAGLNLLDTAPGYGLSEQRIGRHLGSRRDACVLSTKLGYAVPGVPDWTGPCISAGVDQALRTLRTDRIDIAHLHSCPRDVLERGEVLDALVRARQDGKVRAIAYSGDDQDLAYALTLPDFDGFMASLNLCDQQVLEATLPRLGARGFIAKRPSANHPWRFDQAPVGDYCEIYWHRWRAMALPGHGLEPGELALRFALSFDGVASAIIGTGNIQHLRQNIAWAEAGPLPASMLAEIRAAFTAHDRTWVGQV